MYKIQERGISSHHCGPWPQSEGVDHCRSYISVNHPLPNFPIDFTLFQPFTSIPTTAFLTLTTKAYLMIFSTTIFS